MPSRKKRGTSTQECNSFTAFKLPSSVTLKGRSQSSQLLHMPPEVLMHIFTQANPVDRAPLALSCKALLAVSQLRKLEIPDPTAHRAPWNVSRSWIFSDLNSVYPKCRCGGLERLLRQIRPKTLTGNIDRSLQLCVDCMRYIPRRKAYWTAKARELGSDDWETEAQEDWDHARKFFSTGIKMQCPRCRLREYGFIIAADVQQDNDPADEDDNTSDLSRILARLNGQPDS